MPPYLNTNEDKENKTENAVHCETRATSKGGSGGKARAEQLVSSLYALIELDEPERSKIASRKNAPPGAEIQEA